MQSTFVIFAEVSGPITVLLLQIKNKHLTYSHHSDIVFDFFDSHTKSKLYSLNFCTIFKAGDMHFKTLCKMSV